MHYNLRVELKIPACIKLQTTCINLLLIHVKSLQFYPSMEYAFSQEKSALICKSWSKYILCSKNNLEHRWTIDLQVLAKNILK